MFWDTLRTRQVSHTTSVPTWGAAMGGFGLWAVPMALYVAGAVRASEGATRALWAADAGAHVFVGALVTGDALRFEGQYWPVQTLVIGVGSTITFTLPALVAKALVDGDDAALALGLGALAAACLANAVMLSLLFEYFHRTRAALPPVRARIAAR